MSAVVLVHGAWHGSWCWKRARRALQARGHEVFTPALTGFADRLHLLSPQVDLETHITDVTNLIRWEELADVCCAAIPQIGSEEQRTSRLIGVSFPIGCLAGRTPAEPASASPIVLILQSNYPFVERFAANGNLSPFSMSQGRGFSRPSSACLLLIGRCSPGDPGGEPRPVSSDPDEEHRASASIRRRRQKLVINTKIAIHFKLNARKV